MCDKHEIATKIDGGVIIVYCLKCGKILDSKTVPEKDYKVLWSETGITPKNDGVILHD